MALETVTYISDLNASNPVDATDLVSTLGAHARIIKSAVKTTFPNVAGAVSASDVELSYVHGVTSSVQTQINTKGAIAGQTWTGTHDLSGATAVKVPTVATNDSSTNAASTAQVHAVVAAASMSATTPVVPADAGKVWGNDGTTPSWGSSLKASVIRFADGTDATKLMAFDLSGFTTGTTRTVTVPNKSGTLAMVGDTGMALLATLTPTLAANVDALTVFSSAYDNYLILLDGIKPATSDLLYARFAVAGVVDAGATAYQGSAQFVVPSAATGTYSSGAGISAVAQVLNANDATNGKVFTRIGISQRDAVPTWDSFAASSFYTPANAISGIRFFWNAGANFAATGSIRIYGYRNS